MLGVVHFVLKHSQQNSSIGHVLVTKSCNSPRLCVYIYPRCSMYGIFTYIYHQNGPTVGKYSIHGASGYLKKRKYKYMCIISTLSRVFDKYHVAKRCCGVKPKNHTHVGSVRNPRSFVLTWFIEVSM